MISKELVTCLAALVLLCWGAAHAPAQCGCQKTGVCICPTGACPCSTPILHQSAQAPKPPQAPKAKECYPDESYRWVALSNHPGHYGLFRGEKDQVGERDPEGNYWQRSVSGKWADKPSQPPLAFTVQSQPAFTPAFMGGGFGGGCAGGR